MSEITKRPRGRPRKNVSDAETAPVQTLERGLNVLSLLARERRSSLTDIALRSGMGTSTAYRLLTTLQNHRFAEFDENTQEWMIGVEAFRIGSGFLNRINIAEAAQPIMHDLMSETGETANLAISDDGDVIFMSQIETQNPIRAFFRPGTRSHMHASGAGKALLAQMSQDTVEALLLKKGLPEFTDKTITKPDLLFAALAQIRKQGWSLDDEEHYAGMRCVAAPIFNAYGKVVAAISVSGPTARFYEAKIADFSAAVRRAAALLTAEIGGHSV